MGADSTCKAPYREITSTLTSRSVFQPTAGPKSSSSIRRRAPSTASGCGIRPGKRSARPRVTAPSSTKSGERAVAFR